MTSEFFFPSVGGVENHIYSISQCLLKLNHKVIILTQERPSKGAYGIRYIEPGIKVYHIPCRFMNFGVIQPVLLSGALKAFYRNILIREGIDIIHIHSLSSMLGISISFLAKYMRIPVIWTLHRYH
jgi:phosphatidylinositol glycan class A protein